MIYKFLFCYLYRLFNAFNENNDGFNEWRPLLAINVLKGIVIMLVINYYSLKTNYVFNIERRRIWIIVLVCFILVVIDYDIFIKKDQWKVILQRFNDKSTLQKFIINILYTIFVFGTIIGLIYSFVLMSK